MKLLDRFLLRHVAGSYIAGTLVFVTCLFVVPAIASLAAALFSAIICCKEIGTLYSTGQMTALHAAGISVRRIALPILLGWCALALFWAPVQFAAVMVSHSALDAGAPAGLRALTIGILSLSTPLLVAVSFPVAARARTSEPWATMFLVSLAYVFAFIVARLVSVGHPVYFVEDLIDVATIGVAYLACIMGMRRPG